jgi:hypothetical protein
MEENSDRRLSQRYPLRLAVKCRRIEPRFRFDGIIVGESLNISSKDLLIASTEAFQPGQVVEASIDWPILLDNRIRLALVVEGEVVTTAEGHAAIRIERHQFRTRGPTEW